MVFDRTDCYWAGAPLEPHDFSAYAYNLRRRMTNFLPPTPYGLVGIVPSGAAGASGGRFRQEILTDGRRFFDDAGRPREPGEYRPVVEQALRAGAARLPVVVRGDVHWSAARLGPGHIRVTLIDPGYLDPEDRDARIEFQHVRVQSCTDILSGRPIPVAGGSAALRIPMGSLRIVDLALRR